MSIAAGSPPFVDRPQLSDEASAYVRALVISGEYAPGTAVRTETIAEALGISTTPAREGLQALRVEGFLELIPRRGFQVAPLTGEDIQDLFLVQALIAGELAARAAENATEPDVDRLEQLHHQLVTAAEAHDDTALEEQNHLFHREVNRLARSRKVLWALELMTRYVPRRFYATIPGWPKATTDDHGKIFDAIKAGKPEDARVAMHRHIVHAGQLLATHFDERLAAAS